MNIRWLVLLSIGIGLLAIQVILGKMRNRLDYKHGLLQITAGAKIMDPENATKLKKFSKWLKWTSRTFLAWGAAAGTILVYSILHTKGFF